jgi:hypothetical protein
MATYDETLTESIGCGDAIAPTTAFKVSSSESIAASETTSVIFNANSQLTESISCSEVIDDLNPTVNASITGSDSNAAGFNSNASATSRVALKVQDMATANKVLSMYLYSKGKQTERHFYAQMSDGDVVEASHIPPTVTTGAFGTSVFTATSTSHIPASWSTYNDFLIYSNGVDPHQIYPGSNELIRQLIVYDGEDATIATIGDVGTDQTYLVTDGDSTTSTNINGIGASGYGRLFIRTPVPASSFTFTFEPGCINDSAVQLSVIYAFNGIWETCSDVVDGTDNGTSSMSQDGTISFTPLTGEMSLYSYGNVGFWYCLEYASEIASSVDVCITEIKYSSTWSGIHNMWDGVPISASEVWRYVDADSAWQLYGSSAIDMSDFSTSDKLVILSPEKLLGIYIDVGETPNTSGGSMTVKYYSSSSVGTATETDFGSKIDATSNASKSGWVTFDNQYDATLSQFQGSGYYNYVYIITSSVQYPSDVTVNIELMPYYDISELGNGMCSCQWKNRMVYTFAKYPQDIYITSAGNPMVLNGEDFIVRRTGDGRANKVVAMKPFYNELMVFQEEKGSQGGCITIWTGTDPSNYWPLVLSTKLGTFSQKSICVIEGLFINTEGTQTEKLICYFLSRNGVFATDGKTIVCISDDVKPYFDPTSTDCIRSGYEHECWLDYDVTYRVLRIGLVTGSSATAPNTFLWYDPFGPTNRRWGTDELVHPISCHAQVESGSGQYPYLQVGGGTSDGYVYLLNYGTNDDGTAINQYIDHELDYHGYVIHCRELVIRCKTQSAGNITITPYENGVAGTARTVSMVAENANETTRRHKLTDINSEGNHIKIRYANSTLDQQMYLLDCGYDLVAYRYR